MGVVVRIDYDGRYVVIELGCEQIRKIALLRMPHTEVTFSFHQFSDEQRTRSSCIVSICTSAAGVARPHARLRRVTIVG